MKVHDIQVRLPQKKDVTEPKWSNGWLDNFKKRFKIKEYVTHGEAGVAEIDDEENIQQMEVVRKKTAKYELRNILNFDETSINQKLTPNRTLATERQSGGKKAKYRFTTSCTINVDGSDNYDLWIIRKSAKPRAFRKRDPRLLGIEYRYNDSAWMTAAIMVEYLNWLNSRMKREKRKVLLLMDNFSAHELAIKQIGGKDILSNVEIEQLPLNTISYQ